MTNDDKAVPPMAPGGGADPRRAMRAAERELTVEKTAEAAVAEVLAGGAVSPMFNTHSQGVLALIASQEMALKEKVADVDAAIARLQAERTDLMLAFSMCEGARRARERGGAG